MDAKELSEKEISEKIDDIYTLVGYDITERLLGVIKKDFVPTWFYETKVPPRDMTPYELVQAGKIDELDNILYYLESGDPF